MFLSGTIHVHAGQRIMLYGIADVHTLRMRAF